MTSLNDRIADTMVKLKFIYDIQEREFWYLETIKITSEDTGHVNEQFVQNLDDHFYELGLEIGSAFNGQELPVELYRFNETLARLFTNRDGLGATMMGTVSETSQKSFDVEGLHDGVKYSVDSTLVVKSISKVLLLKLKKLRELIGSKDLSHMELRLLDSILVQNLSHRMLKPYHDLLFKRASYHLTKLY